MNISQTKPSHLHAFPHSLIKSFYVRPVVQSLLLWSFLEKMLFKIWILIKPDAVGIGTKSSVFLNRWASKLDASLIIPSFSTSLHKNLIKLSRRFLRVSLKEKLTLFCQTCRISSRRQDSINGYNIAAHLSELTPNVSKARNWVSNLP